MDITINTKSWRGTEEALAERLAQIIGYTESCPPFYRDEKWQLNSSNDWWLEFNAIERTAVLRYRYTWSDSEWEALKTVLNKLVCRGCIDPPAKTDLAE